MARAGFMPTYYGIDTEREMLPVILSNVEGKTNKRFIWWQTTGVQRVPLKGLVRDAFLFLYTLYPHIDAIFTFFPNPKSLGNALWQLWVFIFALWTQRAFWENSLRSSGLRALPKWIPQVTKETPRETCMECVCERLYAHMYGHSCIFTGFTFKSKRQISGELLFCVNELCL